MKCQVIVIILINLFIYELYMNYYYYQQNADLRLEACAGHFVLN